MLEDFEDYARQHKVDIFPIEKAKMIREIREIRENSTPETPYIPNLPHDLETAVNLMITILNQTNYLLDRQITALEQKFINEGGYSEKLFKNRLAAIKEEK